MPILKSTQTTYTTDDEQVFTDEKEAVIHQALLEGKPGIDAFIEQLPGSEKHQKTVRRYLMDFIPFDAARKFKLDQEAEEAGL